MLHVAFEDSQGFCVAEIWESQAQHDSYFNEKVVPNVPAEIKQEVVRSTTSSRPSPYADRTLTHRQTAIWLRKRG